jgi:hypothetical protein
LDGPIPFTATVIVSDVTGAPNPPSSSFSGQAGYHQSSQLNFACLPGLTMRLEVTGSDTSMLRANLQVFDTNGNPIPGKFIDAR